MGEWKDGFVTKGVLYYKNFEMAITQETQSIFKEVQGQGVWISSDNKWLYEGGLKNKKFHGYGWLYCSFHQYKHGNFIEDLHHGHTYKMRLVSGEISMGEYKMNKKIGVSKRLTNSGYFIVTGHSLD